MNIPPPPKPPKNNLAINLIAAFVVLMVFVGVVMVSCSDGRPSGPSFQTKNMVLMRNGKIVQKLKVEVAETPDQWAFGLMFRHEMKSDHGMLFVYPELREIEMWMKNTFIPLDMIFFDSHKKVVAIMPNQQPKSVETINPGVKSRYVLEVNAGLTTVWNLQHGDYFMMLD